MFSDNENEADTEERGASVELSKPPKTLSTASESTASQPADQPAQLFQIFTTADRPYHLNIRPEFPTTKKVRSRCTAPKLSANASGGIVVFPCPFPFPAAPFAF